MSVCTTLVAADSCQCAVISVLWRIDMMLETATKSTVGGVSFESFGRLITQEKVCLSQHCYFAPMQSLAPCCFAYIKQTANL
jgi:hypothetical protein